MKCMHTKLPDFLAKVQAAGKKLRPETKVSIKGLENIQTAKLASLRVGRIEDEIVEVTEDPEITEVVVEAVPFNPEIIYTIITKGYTADGKCKKAILEDMACSIPTVEHHVIDVEEVVDRRSAGPKQTQF